eukprot:5244231-Prymnesium_polylepis.3
MRGVWSRPQATDPVSGVMQRKLLTPSSSFVELCGSKGLIVTPWVAEQAHDDQAAESHAKHAAAEGADEAAPSAPAHATREKPKESGRQLFD